MNKFEQENKYELVYKGEKKKIPESMKKDGWGEEYQVLISKSDGIYAVSIDADFQDGVDPLDLMPTLVKCSSLEEAEAKVRGAESDLESWVNDHQ